MSRAIIVAGVAGLAAVLFGFVALTSSALRRRRYGEIALALGVAAVVIALLVTYGDNLLR